VFPAGKKGSSYIQSVPLFDLKDSTKLTLDELVHLVVNETPLFPSGADFNQISSVWAKCGYWQAIGPLGSEELANSILWVTKIAKTRFPLV
jgi:hypothetical protein